MTYAEQILPEFDEEMASTRKVLERIPEDKLDWKPHPRSNTIGWNANHLAEMVGWVEGVLAHPGFDMAPPGGPRYESPAFATRKEILDLFDRSVVEARKAIQSVKEESLGENWSLLESSKPLLTLPRFLAVRTFILNHIVHHRAILCVYLRMNDVPVPGMYGPSGDESPS